MANFKKSAFNRYEPPSPSLIGDEFIEETFLKDVDKMHDMLPQPFRRIDKIVSEIFDQAWITIEKYESKIHQQATKVNLRKVLYEEELLIHEKFRCCAACDGYFFVGTTSQIIVYEVPKLSKVADYCYIGPDQNSNVCEQILVVDNADDIALLIIKDDQCQIRVLGFKCDALFVVQEIKQERNSDGAHADMILLSDDGLYLAVSWDDSQKQWLDVYKLPKEEWMSTIDSMEILTENEATVDEKEKDDCDKESNCSKVSNSSSHQVSFTKIHHILRVNPPSLKPCQSTNISAILKNIEVDSNVIGSGSHHLMTSTFFEHLYSEFKAKSHFKEDVDLTKRAHTQSTVHFLRGQLTSSLFPSKNDTDSTFNSILVWWKHSNQICMYTLKPSKDLEQSSFSILPQACSIELSSVSSQTDLFAVGLVNKCISVWNRYVGQPLKVFMPIESITMLKFSSVYHGNLQNRLTYATESGKLFQMTCECNGITAPICIDDRSSLAYDKEAVLHTVESPMNLMTVIWKSGIVIIYNEASSLALCELELLSEKTNNEASRLHVAYTKEYILAIRDESEEDRECSRIFLFEPDEYPILQPFFHFLFLTEDEEQEEKVDNLEKNFLRFLRRRKLSDESLHARISTQKRELMQAR